MFYTSLAKRFGFLLLLISVFTACKHTYYVNETKTSHYIINTSNTDSAATAIISPYKQKLDKEMNQVISKSTDAFTKADVESTLGNFVSDAVLAQSKKIVGKDSSTIDIVLLNKGGLRNSLPKGTITVGNIFELMPFDNELVMIQITGEKFNELLAKIIEKGGIPIAGMRLIIHQNKAKDVMIKGQPFDITKNYTIVTSDYLANGGDSYTFMQNPVSYKLLNKRIRDVLIEYCEQQHKNNSILTPYLDGRIQLSK